VFYAQALCEPGRMLNLSKREWAGVIVILMRTIAAVLFIISVVVAGLWLRSSYNAPLEWEAFWTWLPQGSEPLLALLGLASAAVLSIASQAEWLATPASEAEAATRTSQPPIASEQEWLSVRGDLIKTVRKHWVDDYLAHTIQRNTHIELNVANAAELLEHPFHIQRTVDRALETMSARSLLQRFDDSGGFLLVLGEPGSGKTVTLVQLTTALLDRAASDGAAPVPVIAPLSTWARDPHPLHEWLTRELVTHYSLSKRTTPQVLKAGKRLVVILDGLDEVPEDKRDECLGAIRQFKLDFNVDVVVACRRAEYAGLAHKFPAGDALIIQPLSADQIDAYLAGQDPVIAAGLHTLLRADTALAELATSPFTLSVLVQVYRAAPHVDLRSGQESMEQLRTTLFRRYVLAAFARKAAASVKPSKAIHWLQYLASRQSADAEGVFYIEKIDEHWPQRQATYALVSALLFVGSLFLVLFAVGLYTVRGVWSSFGIAARILVAVGVMSFMVVLVDERTVLEFEESYRIRRGRISKTKIGHLLVETGKVLALSAVLWLVLGWVFFGWFIAFRAYTYGMVVTFLGYAVEVVFETYSSPAPARPNEVVRNTAMSAIGIGSASALLIGLPLSYVFKDPIWTLGVGSSAVYAAGGTTVVMHYAIRLTLELEGNLPLLRTSLVQFLDEMCTRIILARIGGGWIFIHRTLLEYLATKPFGQSPSEIEQALRSG